ncbi:MAG: hypothetical protein JO235_06630 [Chroococcidiopsidaceae cyanobacterium CP_BM_RX_35]|nr:hypothetical protein [Chroococcidiopsidaceae cyanobacterium CP_BM_RX_35]
MLLSQITACQAIPAQSNPVLEQSSFNTSPSQPVQVGDTSGELFNQKRQHTYYTHTPVLPAQLSSATSISVLRVWWERQENGGLQFWVQLPQHTQAKSIIHRAAERRVGLWSGTQSYDYHTQEAAYRLILGFGALTPLLIDQAFDRLSGL